MTITDYRADIAILGGGIAGLWLLNLLADRGYSTVLVEKETLGAGQTLASQGMIHGGIKYALDGFLNNASETIAAMPGRWNDCLNGSGSIDLSAVKTLSTDYYLFSDAGLFSKATAFIGSKTIESRIKPVPKSKLPPVFNHPGFKGLVYQLQDIVLDTRSLVAQLASQHHKNISTGPYRIESSDSAISSLVLADGSRVSAAAYICCAGTGNGELVRQLGLPVSMQVRPLCQVIVSGDNLPQLFAHAVNLKSGDKPRLTITTHESDNGSFCWYIGGQLAETGVTRSDDEQISFAKSELASVFPWMNFDDCEFSVCRIDRAEASQADQRRPDTPYANKFGNTIVCWPTKLTLAPMLGDMVAQLLDIAPSNQAPFAGFTSTVRFSNAAWEQDS